MDDLMTEAYREACACAPSSVVDLITLQLDHASFPEPVRLVDDHDDLTATIETGETVTFNRFAFEAVEPEVNHAGEPELVVTVDGASAEIAEAFNALADSPNEIKVILRAWRSDQLTVPGRRLLAGEVRHVRIDTDRVRLRIGFGDVSNLPFPAALYTAARFPGLVR